MRALHTSIDLAISLCLSIVFCPKNQSKTTQQTISPEQINAHCIHRSLSIRSKELVNYLCCTNNRIFIVGSVYLHRLNAAEKSLDNEDLLRTFFWTFHAFADRPLSNRPINKWNRF